MIRNNENNSGDTRDVIFISHANPEDNEFTLWLTLQLSKHGYLVWSDLTNLIGGEDFWNNAESVIRENTTKFLYVLSTVSNSKQGPLQELHVAQNVARDNELSDFIIPLHIDLLPHRDINIQLARINAISFEKSWASGLKNLIEKLEVDQVYKNTDRSVETVTSWWNKNIVRQQDVVAEQEEYIANWISIKNLPDHFYVHKLFESTNFPNYLLDDSRYPIFFHKQSFVTFLDFDNLPNDLKKCVSNSVSMSIILNDDISKSHSRNRWNSREIRNSVFRLLRLAWDKMLIGRSLPVYELSNRNKCFYFTNELLKRDRVSFIGVNNKNTSRQLVGFKSIGGRQDGRRKKRVWHFAISARPLMYPLLAYILKPHVVFSDDGNTIWDSKERLHSARRSQCKNWWNDDWRDRILAAIHWLSNGQDRIDIPIAPYMSLIAEPELLTCNSPVTYKGSVAVESDSYFDDDEVDTDVETG